MAPNEWQPASDMQLEPNALTAAATTDRNIVVTAGPGAGKTELLAQRADFLLRTGHCRYPRRILAISFKVDAARNLKDRVRRRCPPEVAARLDSYTFHAFALRLIDAFRPVLTGADELDADYTVGPDRVYRHQIDFDSMAPLATNIIEISAVARAALRQTYGFVFLDEFQDCTSNQYNLVRAAFHDTDAKIIAVGDVKQRIMGWAGALEGVVARFADDFNATPLILYLNHRAQPRLQRMQNAMVQVMDPQAASPDTDLSGDGGTVDVRRYHDSFDEARDLAETIEKWIRQDAVPAEEIAVLVGKWAGTYTEHLRTELRARNVPFREEYELQDLAAEPIATLIVDFLTVVTTDRDPDAYARLLDVTLGWTTDDDAAERYVQLRQSIDAARHRYRQNQHEPLRALADDFLDILGDNLLTGLAPQYQQEQRLKDLIEQVHTHLEQLQAAGNDAEAALREFAGRDAVKIMTIHKAKGLEFDNVIVLAVENEMFWSDNDDDRSAFFVAISRARHQLLLTVCEQRSKPAGHKKRWNIQRTAHTEFIGYASNS